MTAIRKELRKAVVLLIGRHARDRCRLSSRGRDAEDGPAIVRGKENHAITVPRPATAYWSGRQWLSCSTCDIDPFELAIRKKTNRLTVGRPERIDGSLGSRQCLRRIGTQ